MIDMPLVKNAKKVLERARAAGKIYAFICFMQTSTSRKRSNDFSCLAKERLKSPLRNPFVSY